MEGPLIVLGSLVVATAGERIASFLIEKSALEGKVESQIESIDGELGQIYAFVRQVEREEEKRQGEQDINKWATKAKELALEAEHVRDTFTIKSVRRRKQRSIFFRIEQYKVDRKLKHIRKKLEDMTHRGEDYVRINTVDVERTADETVALSIKELNGFLGENLLTCCNVKKLVQQVRHEFITMHNVLTNLETPAESSERQKILEEQVKHVCRLTQEAVQDYNQRQTWWRMVKFKKKMKRIKTQMQVACHRRWAYGIGDFADGWGGTRPLVPRKTLKRRILLRILLVALWFSLLPLPIVIYVALDLGPGSIWPYFISLCPVALVVSVQVATLWRSADKNLKMIRSNLDLMHALFEDVEGAQNLNERQKTWIEQVRVLAKEAENLADKSRRARERGLFRGCALNVVPRLKLARDMNRMLHRFAEISERKKDYSITTIVGRRVPIPGDHNIQGAEINSIPVPQHTAVNSEETPPAASQAANRYRPVKGFKAKVKSLQDHMQLMDAIVRDVENMGNLDGKATAWVEEMRKIEREAKSFICNTPNCCTRTKKMKRIMKKIKGALRGKKPNGLEQQTGAESFSTVPRRHPSLTVKESDIIGLDDDVEVLREQLLSATKEARLCVTSIAGIKGIGKTTLARVIFNDAAVKAHFHYRVWVSMPPNNGLQLLLEDNQDIANQIPEVQGWTSQEDLIRILGNLLANKRYLIVVDDAQTTQIWDNLAAIPDKSMGSRVLLTSRHINVASHIAGPTCYPHPLQLLDDENSWALFKKFLKVNITEDEEKKLEKIVIQCGGLPSEIIKMANLLSDVNKEEWSRVLEQLQQDQTPWLETLDMIYEGHNVHLKRCLSYFSLFQANFKIPARRLIVLWVAEGMVRHKDQNEESPECVAERYLTQLIARNIVQVTKRKDNGKVKTCRLPDAFRKILSGRAEYYNFGSSDTISTASRRRLADRFERNDASFNHIHGVDRIATATLKKCYKDVLSFLSFDIAREGSKPGEEVGNFLKRCISVKCFLLLRVLDLERVYKPKLPKEIGKLRRMNYLGLRWTYLESLPSSIGKLLRLQTLDLKHTYISTLPCSIWEMELRHLYLSETYRSRFPSQRQSGSGYLTDLQTLWGLFVDEECPVKGGLDKLANLKKLGLACQPMSSQQQAMESQLVAIADWLLRLKDLQSLRLKSGDEKGRPWDLHLKSLSGHKHLTEMSLLGKLNYDWSTGSLFPPSLVELTLSHSGLMEDPMQILNDLPNLQSLHLHSESYMGKNMLCKSGSFPQLRILKIWKLEELEEWDIEQEALPSLRQLEIRSCGCLKMLPVGLKHVLTLIELKLTSMPKQFNNRIKDRSSEDWHKIQHIHSKVFYDDSP